MKNLFPSLESARIHAHSLAAWHQSLISVSIESQVKPDGPWLPSQTKPAIKADHPDADSTVDRWIAEGNDLVSKGKLHSWRIVLTAEPQVHSFSTVSPAKPMTGTNALGVKPPLPHDITAQQDDGEDQQ